MPETIPLGSVWKILHSNCRLWSAHTAKNHTSALSVANSSFKNEPYRCIKEPTQARNHRSVFNVTKYFIQKGQLQKQQMTRTGKYPIVLSGKSFSGKSDLPICQKKKAHRSVWKIFQSERTLAKLPTNSHSEKPYECSHCGAEFTASLNSK